MKECDILGGSKHTPTPYIFSGVKTPNPRIYAPASNFYSLREYNRLSEYLKGLIYVFLRCSQAILTCLICGYSTLCLLFESILYTSRASRSTWQITGQIQRQ